MTDELSALGGRFRVLVVPGVNRVALEKSASARTGLTEKTKRRMDKIDFLNTVLIVPLLKMWSNQDIIL